MRRGKRKFDGSDDPEIAANTMICLIHQATYLLRRQLDGLERQFLASGGFTERLYDARRSARNEEYSATPCARTFNSGKQS